MNQQQTLTPGTETQGGFFAGFIKVDDKQYGVIVSPKATGERTGIWGERGKEIPATDIADGLANTKAMAEAGSEIATWALDLEINGYSDWYIPSRDELEVMYRSLKPTDRKNFCSFKDGENISSAPLGGPYTSESPTQTEATAFKEGREEAFEPAWHWSSTQYSADGAFCQDFVGGGQGGDGKDVKLRVRAVRRFLID